MHVTQKVHVAGGTVAHAAILDQEVTQHALQLVPLLDQGELKKVGFEVEKN